MRRLACLFPGALGAAAVLITWRVFDGAEIAREIEAATAILAGLITWGLAEFGLPRAMARESEIEKKLVNAGLDTNQEALRALSYAEEARDRVARMRGAAQKRTKPLLAALEAFEDKLAPLLEDTVTSPETARRADDLLRRTLPRLEEAFVEYCAFADRGDGVVDTQETRDRMIQTLAETGEKVDGARRAIIQTTRDDVDVSLGVLEDTLARSR
ncbi:hypothetical protein R3X27_15715 [Tropicimonas sp. TH_r6]|uniref:hypothetical protein n=1 Tax=Tropicimonas sp. TH_r6 TaxID=3082085 RepID=UPI0029549E9E|nr:hypothetical protein [Tropicimonas sp. TH_r6]MDV7144135.1 hypothetical protein [Tropicimonas sp. TH_r6]